MPQEALRAITPVGRIIWGSVSERATQDYDGNNYEAGKGPFQFGFAVLKTDPAVGGFLGQLYQQAKAGYSNNANMGVRIDNEWNGGFQGLNFRFKVKDGDRPNADGTMNANAKGCWVFAMSTTLPFKCGNAQNVEIDPKTVKRGYYCDVACSIKINEKTDGTAGIYINPNVVRLIAFGEEIVGGISVEDAFKGHAAPTALPPGASITPVAPAGGIPLPAGATSLPPGQTGNVPSALPTPGGIPASVPSAAIPLPQTAVAPAATAPRFDPATGQPITTAAPPAQAIAGYDPATGAPIYAAAPTPAPVAAAPVITGYDPATGAPIYAGAPAAIPAPVQAAQVIIGYNQQTGQPIYGAPNGGLPQPNPTSTTGYPINPATGQAVQPYPGILQPPGQ